jgi:hypothetical protein
MSVKLTRSPHTSDGREIIQSSRFRGDVDPYICGVGDHRTNGKGQGSAFNASWATQAEAADETVDFIFNDWVYVSAGGVEWTGGKVGDTIDMWAEAAASASTPNGGGTGNANALALGGGAFRYDPADGDGDTDLVLTDYSCVPIPSYDADSNPIGQWEWSNPDSGAGVLTAAATVDKGSYAIYNFSAKLVHWVCALPLIGDGQTLLDPQTKARKMLPHWTFKVKVHNSGHDDLSVVWWLNTARKSTV